mmetsp:Transcript_4438/g.10230  ORF Transcript_4438/g.10230 Transcript_4438/m.10230 type:complete len:112 (-) Transcript_4438:613-948(-)
MRGGGVHSPQVRPVLQQLQRSSSFRRPVVPPERPARRRKGPRRRHGSVAGQLLAASRLLDGSERGAGLPPEARGSSPPPLRGGNHATAALELERHLLPPRRAAARLSDGEE